MLPTRRETWRWLALTLATGLAALALACAPIAPAGQDAVLLSEPTHTPTPAPSNMPTPTRAERDDTSRPATTTALADTPAPKPVNTDPCGAVVSALNESVAPYVFGMGSGSGGVKGASGQPEPTITVAGAWHESSIGRGELYPPTVENRTPVSDLVVQGFANTRVNLLFDDRDLGASTVLGFVNFRVSEYLKGSGSEYVCVIDFPEIDPNYRMLSGNEYVIMLHQWQQMNAYRIDNEIGWQVEGDSALQLPEAKSEWYFIISSDRRSLDTIWLTPEPDRVFRRGESSSLEKLKQRIKAAAASATD